MTVTVDPVVERDLRTLARFINVYCQGKHPHAVKALTTLKTHDLSRILGGKSPFLCDDCRKLLIHAFVKRSNCPMHPKPMCKHCPNHCYHPTYRDQIREVMRYSGRKILLGGRIDYLFHLLF